MLKKKKDSTEFIIIHSFDHLLQSKKSVEILCNPTIEHLEPRD